MNRFNYSWPDGEEVTVSDAESLPDPERLLELKVNGKTLCYGENYKQLRKVAGALVDAINRERRNTQWVLAGCPRVTPLEPKTTTPGDATPTFWGDRTGD